LRNGLLTPLRELCPASGEGPQLPMARSRERALERKRSVADALWEFPEKLRRACRGPSPQTREPTTEQPDALGVPDARGVQGARDARDGVGGLDGQADRLLEERCRDSTRQHGQIDQDTLCLRLGRTSSPSQPTKHGRLRCRRPRSCRYPRCADRVATRQARRGCRTRDPRPSGYLCQQTTPRERRARSSL
jgi:hypothetical protein